MKLPLNQELWSKMHTYWQAANYLSVGQIYLLANPLLKEPLQREHVKPRLLGHWGTTPGLNFIYVHLNRVIKERSQPMICVIRRNWTGNPSETGQSFRAKLDSRSEATHGVLVVYS